MIEAIALGASALGLLAVFLISRRGEKQREEAQEAGLETKPVPVAAAVSALEEEATKARATPWISPDAAVFHVFGFLFGSVVIGNVAALLAENTDGSFARAFNSVSESQRAGFSFVSAGMVAYAYGRDVQFSLARYFGAFIFVAFFGLRAFASSGGSPVIIPTGSALSIAAVSVCGFTARAVARGFASAFKDSG